MSHPNRHQWMQQVRSRLLPVLAIGGTIFSSGAALPPTTSPTPMAATQLADIIINVPIIVPNYPVIVVPREPEDQEVVVRFIAQGNDWATIYLDNRILFRAANTRRNHEVILDSGAYRLQITGVSRFDVWDSGYLDLGRNDANVVVIRYSKDTGIQVAGDPYAWIPD